MNRLLKDIVIQPSQLSCTGYYRTRHRNFFIIMMVHYFRRFERLLERYDPESDVFVKPCVHSKIWDTHIISMHKKPYEGHDVN